MLLYVHVRVCYMARRLLSVSAVNTHGENRDARSSAVDFTRSPPIPQLHLSSHELRVETEFSQVENCSCLFYQQRVPYFPHEILQPARDTAKGAGKQLNGH